MSKAAGETITLWMTDVCNAVVKDGKVPEDWSRSWMVNVYITLHYIIVISHAIYTLSDQWCFNKVMYVRYCMYT